MEDALIPVLIVGMLFIGLPWLIFHYVTRWKGQASLTREDEGLIDEMHALVGRLAERVGTVERIVTADNPHWRAIANDPAPAGDLQPIETSEAKRRNQ
jgi:phage shock protein B